MYMYLAEASPSKAVVSLISHEPVLNITLVQDFTQITAFLHSYELCGKQSCSQITNSFVPTM